MANTAYGEMKMEEDATYGKMQESLMEEARELSILCGVDVALLCAGGPGTGDGDGGGGGVGVGGGRSRLVPRHPA